MEQEKNCNCYDGVDQMINEGLGGGFIIYEYDKNKLEPIVKVEKGQSIDYNNEGREKRLEDKVVTGQT